MSRSKEGREYLRIASIAVAATVTVVVAAIAVVAASAVNAIVVMSGDTIYENSSRRSEKSRV